MPEVTEKSKRRDQQAPRVVGEIYTVLTIGQRIRYARECRQLKQTELAERTGLTQAAISNLETDATRKPSGPSLLKIASALDVGPDWLLQGVGEMSTTAAAVDEVDLLRRYRARDRGGRAQLLAVARELATATA